MVVKIKLKDALLKQKETVKQLKRLQNRIIVQGTKEFLTTAQITELEELLKEQELLRSNVVLLKLALRKNIDDEIVKSIFQLSELKEYLKCLDSIVKTVPISTNSKIDVTTALNNTVSKIASIEEALNNYNENVIELEIIEPEMTLIKSNI